MGLKDHITDRCGGLARYFPNDSVKFAVLNLPLFGPCREMASLAVESIVGER